MLPTRLFCLQIEKLLEITDSVLGASDSVADGPLVAKDLVVVAALKGLVTKEVDVLVSDTAVSGVVLEVLEAVGLVPTSGEDVEGDLTANGEAIEGKSASWVTLRSERRREVPYVRPKWPNRSRRASTNFFRT